MQRIGVDLHGTLTKDVEGVGILKYLMKTHTLNKDHEYWIISGSKNKELIEKELISLGIKKGIHYKEIVSIVEYLEENGAEFTWDSDGNPWCHEEIWWFSKYSICSKNNIFLMIDDKKEYGEYFVDKHNFILYDDFINNLKKD